VNLDAIREQIDRCSPEEQDQLAACLCVLRLRRNPEHRQLLGSRLTDDARESWLTAEELKKNLEAE
jgi:hypothetical protein